MRCFHASAPDNFRRRDLEKAEKKYETKLVCAECGKTHIKEEAADSNKSDQWKLVALAAGGIFALLLIWVWVFKWGVPLVKHIQGIE